MHRLWLNPTALLRLAPSLLGLLLPSCGGLRLPQRVALLLRPTAAYRGLGLHRPRLRHGGRLSRLHRVRLLANRCTNGCCTDWTWKGRSHFSRLAPDEFFHRDLPVPVDVCSGMKPGGLFQIRARGFCQLLDRQTAGLVLVSGKEALLVGHGFRLWFVHGFWGWSGRHHGAKSPCEGIRSGLILSTVVEFGHRWLRNNRGVVGRTGQWNAG